jgi:peptidoglycan/xylan/chitin deacetylase (PgdA/CDA1 family)
MNKKAYYVLGIVILFGILLLFPQPNSIVLISPSICPEAVYFFKVDRPLIALTIDDSPDPQTTLKILEVLQVNQAKATFFAISSEVEKYPEVITQIVDRGNEIGNHLTRDEPSINLGDKFEAELITADRILRQFDAVTWLRPGKGFCDRDMIKIATKHNYKMVLGSIWSYDTNLPFANFSTWFILHNLHPGGIIVLHDAGNNGERGNRTVKTLKRVLPELSKRGYRVVTLSELATFNETKD